MLLALYPTISLACLLPGSENLTGFGSGIFSGAFNSKLQLDRAGTVREIITIVGEIKSGLVEDMRCLCACDKRKTQKEAS